jgi:hypothetical protein
MRCLFDAARGALEQFELQPNLQVAYVPCSSDGGGQGATLAKADHDTRYTITSARKTVVAYRFEWGFDRIENST